MHGYPKILLIVINHRVGIHLDTFVVGTMLTTI